MLSEINVSVPLFKSMLCLIYFSHIFLYQLFSIWTGYWTISFNTRCLRRILSCLGEPVQSTIYSVITPIKANLLCLFFFLLAFLCSLYYLPARHAVLHLVTHICLLESSSKDLFAIHSGELHLYLESYPILLFLLQFFSILYLLVIILIS